MKKRITFEPRNEDLARVEACKGTPIDIEALAQVTGGGGTYVACNAAPFVACNAAPFVACNAAPFTK